MFELVLAGLLGAVAREGKALGTNGVTVGEYAGALLDESRRQPLFAPVQGAALDDYIEAQIHGELRMDRDIEAIVADPSFLGGATGEILAATAKRYGLSLEWHAGFAIRPAEVPDDFRGPEMQPLAERVLKLLYRDGERFDAAAIGQAAVSVVSHPEEWEDWGLLVKPSNRSSISGTSW